MERAATIRGAFERHCRYIAVIAIRRWRSRQPSPWQNRKHPDELRTRCIADRIALVFGVGSFRRAWRSCRCCGSSSHFGLTSKCSARDRRCLSHYRSRSTSAAIPRAAPRGSASGLRNPPASERPGTFHPHSDGGNVATAPVRPRRITRADPRSGVANRTLCDCRHAGGAAGPVRAPLTTAGICRQTRGNTCAT